MLSRAFQIVLLAGMGLLAAAASPAPTAPAQREPRAPASAQASLRQAIAALTREARQAKKAGELPRNAADFAQAWPHAIDRDQLAREMTAPIAGDDFIDAYVRWQLTSFEPILPEMNEREFERLLARLPKFLDNPHANERFMQTLARAGEAGPLSESDFATVKRMFYETAAELRRTVAMNQPAAGLRDWLDTSLENRLARRVEARLARCAAMIDAGWNVDEVKRELDELFTEAGKDVDVTDEERQRLAKLATRLAGRRRSYVGTTILSIEQRRILGPDILDAAILDVDANRWVKSLSPESGS